MLDAAKKAEDKSEKAMVDAARLGDELPMSRTTPLLPWPPPSCP